MNVITLRVGKNVYNALCAKCRCFLNDDLNMTEKAAENRSYM